MALTVSPDVQLLDPTEDVNDVMAHWVDDKIHKLVFKKALGERAKLYYKDAPLGSASPTSSPGLKTISDLVKAPSPSLGKKVPEKKDEASLEAAGPNDKVDSVPKADKNTKQPVLEGKAKSPSEVEEFLLEQVHYLTHNSALQAIKSKEDSNKVASDSEEKKTPVRRAAPLLGKEGNTSPSRGGARGVRGGPARGSEDLRGNNARGRGSPETRGRGNPPRGAQSRGRGESPGSSPRGRGAGPRGALPKTPVEAKEAVQHPQLSRNQKQGTNAIPSSPLTSQKPKSTETLPIVNIPVKSEIPIGVVSDRVIESVLPPSSLPSPPVTEAPQDTKSPTSRMLSECFNS